MRLAELMGDGSNNTDPPAVLLYGLEALEAKTAE